MTPENKHIPDWAQRERETDLTWIAKNLDVFQIAATLSFEEVGRGAIVVDTTIQSSPDVGHPFGYFSLEQVEQMGNDDIQRMVGEYEPDRELVLVLLKSGDRTSTYRVRALDPENKEADEERGKPGGDVPSLETLMYWEMQGGCEAACPHGCWVEPDGTCPHGNPSWLLKLGLI